MRRWWLLLLVVPVLAGCLPPHDSYSAQAGLPRGVTLTITNDYGDTPALEQAIQWWNGLAGQQLFAYGPGPVTIHHGDPTDWCGDGAGVLACSAGYDAAGQYHDPPDYAYTTCEILVEPGVDAWTIYAHELGHCLGFHHVTDRTSIMAPGYPDPSNPAGDQQMLQAGGY